MQYRPDLREAETLGDLKDGAQNKDETRYIRECDSTEEEEEHKNNFIKSLFCDLFYCVFVWCSLLVSKIVESKKMHSLRNIEAILKLSSYVYIGLSRGLVFPGIYIKFVCI